MANEQLDELLSTFGLIKVDLITEGDCAVAGQEIASALNLTCDGYQEEIGKYYISDDNKIISDTMRVSFFAKNVDDAVEKLIMKIKQFNPDSWKERVNSWLSSIDDSFIKSKACTFLV